MNILGKKVLSNTLWIMSEKIVSIFGLIFVTSLVAKYIGAENFGKLNLSLTIFAIIQIFSFFGSQDLIFQRTSRKAQSAWYLVKKTQIIRDVAFYVTSLPTLLYLYFYTDEITFYFGLATAIATYIAIHDLYATYFNAKLKSYLNTICNVIGLTVSLAARFIIAFFELNILWLTVPIVLLVLIPFTIRWYLFNFREEKSNFSEKYATAYKKHLFFNGANLVPYTLSVAIFTRLSQLFLSLLVGMSALGIYSVVITVGSGLSMVIAALVSSLSVGIFAEKDNENVKVMITKAFVIVSMLCIVFYIGIYLLGDWFIHLLYGSEYQQAADYLLIYVFAIWFATFSGLSEKYILRAKGYPYLFKKMMLLLMISSLISYTLISYYGILGAVISVVIIEVITSTILNYFFKKGEIFHLHKFIILNTFNPRIWK